MTFTSSGRFVRCALRRARVAKRVLHSPNSHATKSDPSNPVTRRKTITGRVGKADFEFDIAGNVIRVKGRSIALQPLETHVLRILLNNRGQITSARSLTRAQLGGRDAPSEAIIDGVIASLHKKLTGTGLEIETNQNVGFEIHALKVPELNRRLSDKILLAMNQAIESGNKAIVKQLRVALVLAKECEQDWLQSHKAREKRALPGDK
jgi:DNA-binding winged helix-turn-helix (wHTH) protein